jgi:glutamate synthase (NADPH/NADH) small chain
MGKPTGFIEWPREAAPKRDKQQRLLDSREFTAPLSAEQANHQAGRCMDCGVPTCHQGCPLGNVIPDFNEHVFHGRWRAAWAALSSTNNFPEFTGRLCPAPCEAACVLAINQPPVLIEQLEKEIIERAFAEGWVKSRPPTHRTGKRVAVVGSGPAGLAAAAQLNQAGHHVTVFERADKLGGLLRYGIPDFKLEKQFIDRRLRLLEAEGIAFQTGADVGGTLGWDELRRTHDAVLIAIGAARPRELQVPGRELQGVVQGMDFLEAANRGNTTDAADKRVIILGGGDTGSDCLGTALRQKAREVIQLELMPAPPAQRRSDNPWPQWPVIFRTSSSQEEGGVRKFALRTLRLEGEGGRLKALGAIEVEPADGGLRDRPGTGVRLEVDLLVLAMGFAGPQTATLAAQLGLQVDGRGNVVADATFATAAPGVYCAGDAYRGASLIVWAIADGREAARSIDAFLGGRPSGLPARDRVPAVGRG